MRLCTPRERVPERTRQRIQPEVQWHSIGVRGARAPIHHRRTTHGMGGDLMRFTKAEIKQLLAHPGMRCFTFSSPQRITTLSPQMSLEVIDQAIEGIKLLAKEATEPAIKVEYKKKLVKLLRARGGLVYSSDRKAAEAAYFLAGAIESELDSLNEKETN